MAEQIEIVHATDRNRFELRVGGQLASFADYLEDDDRRIFVHTQTIAEHAERGLATRLVKEALQQTTSDGKHVVASCPFVAWVVQQHPELVPAP